MYSLYYRKIFDKGYNERNLDSKNIERVSEID